VKLFVDNPSQELVPLIETLNEMKIPFDEVSLVEADFFDFFQVKPFRQTDQTGEVEV
jgi:hypothetical protein